MTEGFVSSFLINRERLKRLPFLCSIAGRQFGKEQICSSRRLNGFSRAYRSASQCRIQEDQAVGTTDRVKWKEVRALACACLDLDQGSSIRVRGEYQQYVLDDIWNINGKELSENPNVTKNPYWRLILINDSHIVRIVRALTKGRSKLNILENTTLETDTYIPHFNVTLPRKWRRRRSCIVDSFGAVLVYSISWWEEDTHAELDKLVRAFRGWNYYDLVHWGIAREVTALHYGYSTELDAVFRQSGPYWAKCHIFKIAGQVRVYNYEVYSPTLSRYIGPVTAPNQE